MNKQDLNGKERKRGKGEGGEKGGREKREKRGKGKGNIHFSRLKGNGNSLAPTDPSLHYMK